MTKTKQCPSCSGTGKIEVYRPPFLRTCFSCHGKGRLPESPDRGSTKGVGADQSEAHSTSADLCYSVLEAGNDHDQ